MALAWHPEVGDPTFLGWFTVIAYALAAWLSLRAGLLRVRQSGADGEAARCWLSIALMLALLGINKQLDLQTLLIELGRRAARAEGWYEQRRLVQLLFVGALAIAMTVFLLTLLVKRRDFIAQTPLALAGIIFLTAFVFIRASTINHADRLLGRRVHDKSWAWILEVGGNICIGVSAAQRSRAW